jgi:hypothetical protein
MNVKSIIKPEETKYIVELTETEAVMICADIGNTNGARSVDVALRDYEIDIHRYIDDTDVHANLYNDFKKMLKLDL